MKHRILIIDDEEIQASNLAKALQRDLNEFEVDYASSEDDIKKKVVCTNFSVAIVDLRMDGYGIDGINVIKLISEVNPYAKVIAVSAYTQEYQVSLSGFISSGLLLAIMEKQDFVIWIPCLKEIITNYFSTKRNPIAIDILENAYNDAKNTVDTYEKGVAFEEFVVTLFRQMGFYHISKRVKDSACNEIDLVVRNDIEDPFFSKFGRYIFVECKNKPEEGFSKNDFIVFNNKVNSSHGDCNMGVVFTTGHIKRTVAMESLKESKFDTRIIYMSSSEIQRLIHTANMLDEFKNLIDDQVVH